MQAGLPPSPQRPRARTATAIFVAVFLAPSYRITDSEAPPDGATNGRPRDAAWTPDGGDQPRRRVTLGLGGASCLFLVIAAVLGAAWSLGVAILCALAAAVLAALPA